MSRTIAIVVLAALAGCATVPDPPVERALYFDVRAVVETQSRIDWVIDEDHLDEWSSAIMTSACRTPTPSRQALRLWINERLAAEGGSAKAVYEANGGDLSAASDALAYERSIAALDYAERRIGECPFWLTADPGFDGVQGNTRRLVWIAESMGSGELVSSDGDWTVGGTGLGRVVPAWGITDRLTLGIGVEAGVGSTFPRTESGGRGVKPVFAGGVPVLLRVLDGTLRYDLDVAAVTRATRNEFEGLRYGGRIGVGLGAATPRVAGVMPYIVIWGGYQHLLAGAGEPATHSILAGTRVGINWDP